MFLLILVCPFNIIYKSSRCRLLRVIRNIIFSPMYKVLHISPASTKSPIQLGSVDGLIKCMFADLKGDQFMFLIDLCLLSTLPRLSC